MALAPLSPPPPPAPKLVPLPLHAAKRQSVIEYLHTKRQPPPDWHRDRHPTYNTTFASTYILSLLPNSSLKTVRLVSRRWHHWAASAVPPLFANLRVDFSPFVLTTMRLRALEGPARECRHLFVTFPATSLQAEPLPADHALLPDFPNLIKLSIEYPNNGLASTQRRALENPAKHCRHLTITFPATTLDTVSPPSDNACLPDFPNLTHLSIEYPNNGLTSAQRHALENPASQCRQLTITFPTHQTERNAPQQANPKLPALPNMENLHLICPTANIFDRLLAFRDTLQKTEPPKLTHLTISNLTINGISALRCGTFTSIGSSSHAARKVWHDLEALDIELIPWCNNMDPTSRQNRSRSEELEWRTALKMLHDWLHSFAIMGKLRRLKFSWRNIEGPNPLLLEDTAKDLKGGNWFSAPPVHWRALKEVWLRNVKVSENDVDDLKERIHGLQCLMVEERLADNRVMGWRRVVDGVAWFEIQLADQVVELEGDLPLFHAQDLVGQELLNGVEEGEVLELERGEETARMEEITIQLDTLPVRGSRHGMIFSRGYSLEGP